LRKNKSGKRGREEVTSEDPKKKKKAVLHFLFWSSSFSVLYLYI